jgi:hypothetical protein
MAPAGEVFVLNAIPRADRLVQVRLSRWGT